MYLDSINICLGAMSLLKYTSIAVPDLNTIIYTMGEFTSNTVRKTIFMILLIYFLFGFMSYFILALYQYGFFNLTYALLRSCIVFLNGFIINEQQVLLSKESVENLIGYNGYLLTFTMLVVINILIRQVMINIVAIYMHNDYNAAKKKSADMLKATQA